MSVQLERFLSLAPASVPYTPGDGSSPPAYCVGGALLAAANAQNVAMLPVDRRFPGPGLVSEAMRFVPELARLPSHRRLARLITEVNDVLSPRAATELVNWSLTWARRGGSNPDQPWALWMTASLLASCVKVELHPASVRFPGPGCYTVARWSDGPDGQRVKHVVFAEFCRTADDLLDQVLTCLLEGSIGIQRACSEGECYWLAFAHWADDESA